MSSLFIYEMTTYGNNTTSYRKIVERGEFRGTDLVITETMHTLGDKKLTRIMQGDAAWDRLLKDNSNA